MTLTLLILGGYGTFGGRIVQLLEGEPGLTLVVAGRSQAKAEAFCRSRETAAATLVPLAFDRDGDLNLQLANGSADILIDASGPFQAYGAAPYRVVEACIAAKVHYLDLADGAAFVGGIGAFDDAARAAGIYVLSGVSSFPVLTACVVRQLARDMDKVASITGGIAPSPYAGVGLNVIRAIAGYAGQPVTMRRNGGPVTAYPFTEQRRFTIGPPGRVPLRRTLFSLVDVPDLRTLPPLWPEVETVWMGAGPVPEILHRALIALAWLVRRRVLPGLSGLSRPMQFATNHLRWGEHRGGMFVEVSGVDSGGEPGTRSWHLLAEGDGGPLIPSMAVEALVRRVMRGESPQPGARAATRELELGDYEALFAARTIHTGLRQDTIDRGQPLYARLLGPLWQEIPAELRILHGATTASGCASVERGTRLIARIIAGIVGFPHTTPDIAVSVTFAVENGVETWTRRFGGQTFHSLQFAGRGRWEHLLCERFGQMTFALALVWQKGRLSLVIRGWTAFGIPLPQFLAPRITAFKTVEDGRFRFHVDIAHRLTGPIVRYKGWLVA